VTDNLAKINDVYVSPRDLLAVLEMLSRDKNPWPRLLLGRDAFNSAMAEEAIVNSVKSWLYQINDADVPGPPGTPRIANATRIPIKPGETREGEIEAIAHAFVYRAAATIRLIVEHILGRSYDRRFALTPEEQDVLSNAHLKRQDFIKAACLTPIKMEGDRPAFNLGEFTERLRQARTLRALDN